MASRPATPASTVELFCGEGEEPLANLSAVARIGDTLFVAGDESARIERFRLAADGAVDHSAIPLDGLLDLADPDEEADIEGLAVDDDRFLWLVGSHARTRRKPEKMEGDRIDLQALADLRDTRPRCLLARLPLVETAEGWRPIRADGDRRAGMIRQGKKGSRLARRLRQDPLLKPFTRIPAKEGGVDIEGIAICRDRIALGMRGPVIASHALMLELRFRIGRSGRIKLRGKPFKRLLALEGLGIRDLQRRGDDLLILAGPTTGLDGPCALYCWAGWAQDEARDEAVVRLHRPERLLDLPYGVGEDHPEGLAVWGEAGREVMIVYDSPSSARRGAGGSSGACDVFALPD